MATLFRYEWHYILYRMTFAQCMGMIQARNGRELRQQKESEKRSKSSKPGVTNGFDDEAYSELSDISEYHIDEDDPDSVPFIEDVLGAMGGMSI